MSSTVDVKFLINILLANYIYWVTILETPVSPDSLGLHFNISHCCEDTITISGEYAFLIRGLSACGYR